MMGNIISQWIGSNDKSIMGLRYFDSNISVSSITGIEIKDGGKVS